MDALRFLLVGMDCRLHAYARPSQLYGYGCGVLCM